MIGYDLDGVLCAGSTFSKSYFRCSAIERREFLRLRKDYYRNAPVLLRPEGEFVIISCRREGYSGITKEWCVVNNLNPQAIYFMPLVRTRQNMIKYKAEKINELGISIFYEDDPKIVKKLTVLCPNTKIVQVNHCAVKLIKVGGGDNISLPL